MDGDELELQGATVIYPGARRLLIALAMLSAAALLSWAFFAVVSTEHAPDVLLAAIALPLAALVIATPIVALRSKRGPGQLAVRARALSLDGTKVCNLSAIQAAFATTSEHGPAVVITRARRPALRILVATMDHARELVRVLGFAARPRVAVFEADMASRGGLAIVAAAVAIIVAALFFVIDRALEILWGPVVAAIVALMRIPSRVFVGADGVRAQWLSWNKFVPIADIESVERMRRGVRLGLRGGGNLELLPAGADPLVCASLADRIEEAVATAQAPACDVTAIASLARENAPVGGWIARLRALGDEVSTFRSEGVPVPQLWRVLEDPRAALTARAAAATALAPHLDDDGRARLREAIATSASNRLRVAVEAAATDDGDALGAELIELEREEQERRR